MAAPMFALQPIPNPTFDIDFGKCLPHKTYTAAELQAWLNKIVNPFGGTWVIGIFQSTLLVDGKGLTETDIAGSGALDMKLYFKNRVNWALYHKMLLDYSKNTAISITLGGQAANNSLTLYIYTSSAAGNIKLTQIVGGVSTVLYQRINLVSTINYHPVEIYMECYTKNIKFWVKTDIPKFNTNGWQSVATTLSVPTNKYLEIQQNLQAPSVSAITRHQHLQMKFMDGVFT